MHGDMIIQYQLPSQILTIIFHTMPTIPQTMRAVITQADKTIAVEEVPVPLIDDDEVLVKTTAIAQNPTDWKCKCVIRFGVLQFN